MDKKIAAYVHKNYRILYYVNLYKAFIKPYKYVKKEYIFLNFFLLYCLCLNFWLFFFDFVEKTLHLYKPYINFLPNNKLRIVKKFFLINTSYSIYGFNLRSVFNSFNTFFSFSDNFKIFFLRKNVIYLKSKFSKVRLFTKNIVYFSLVLNIIVINELHLIYYNISINYSYFFFFIIIIFIIEWVLNFFKTNKGGSLIEEQRSSKPLILVQVQSTLACSAH